MVTAQCWLPMSTMPSDCLARSPASQVVSIGGRPWGTGNTWEQSIPSKGKGMCKGPEAAQALVGLGNLQERENFLPQPQGYGLCKLDWHVIQPVSKQGLKQSYLGLNLSSAYKLCDSGPVTLPLWACFPIYKVMIIIVPLTGVLVVVNGIVIHAKCLAH